MIITGLFFAEYARVSEDMLDILGGVWDTCTVPSGAPAECLPCALYTDARQSLCGCLGPEFNAGLRIVDVEAYPLFQRRRVDIEASAV